MHKLLRILLCLLSVSSLCLAQPTTIDGFFDKDLKPDNISIEDHDDRASSSFHITCRFSTLKDPVVFDCTYY